MADENRRRHAAIFIESDRERSDTRTPAASQRDIFVSSETANWMQAWALPILMPC
jgi:hypothetical protein